MKIKRFSKRFSNSLKKISILLLGVLIIFALTLFGGFFISTRAQGVTILVPENYSTIQAAITAASDGDTIDVKEGWYGEYLTINKQVTIQTRATNTTPTYIYGTGLVGPNSEKVRFIAGSDGAILKGFTIRDGSGHGIYVQDGVSPEISNNIIIVNGNGIYCTGGGSPSIKGNTIGTTVDQNTGNGIENNGCSPVIESNIIKYNNANGIYNYNDSDAEIFNNEISFNGANGITNNDSKPVIYNNQIVSNTADGIDNANNADAEIYGNTITGNVIGVDNDDSGSDIIDNTISSNTSDGIENTNGSNSYISGNTINGNTGSGIDNDDSNPYVYSNTISGNVNGIFNTNNSSPDIIDNKISSNTMAGIDNNAANCSPFVQANKIQGNVNGIRCNLSTNNLEIVNNLIISNTTTGILLVGISAGPKIINNTFDGNVTGINSANNNPIIKNNIITNGGVGIINGPGGAGNNNYNNIWNNTTNYGAGYAAGANNLSVFPFYMGGGDYQLQSVADGYGSNDSPCIDKGDPDVSFNDKDEPPARGTATNDMGAFGGPKIYKPKPPTIVLPVAGWANDPTPSVSGVLETNYVGDKVKVYSNNINVGSDTDLTYDGTEGTFDLTTSNLGLDGLYALSARIISQTGVESDDSASVNYQLDITKPISSVVSLSAYQTTSIFSVPYTASDGATGSGIDHVELWYNKDGAGWVKYGDFTSSPITFDSSTTGGDGTYGFYTIAWDVAGNMEDAPVLADATTEVDTIKPAAPSSLTLQQIDPNLVRLSWIAPGDDGNIGQASSYDARFMLSYVTESKWSLAAELSGEPAPSIAGSIDSMIAPIWADGVIGAKTDTDAEGLSDYRETIIFQTKPDVQDTDGDTYSDATEVYYGYSPLNPSPNKIDTDGDGLIDYLEAVVYKTDPTKADTDGDGYSDRQEIYYNYNPLNSNPDKYDTDSDGLTNYQEWICKTNPNDPDTDNDGYPDGIEVKNYYNPVNIFYFGLKAKDNVGWLSDISNIGFITVW